MSHWITIGATVENEVVIASTDNIALEAITEKDFDIIVKTYGVSPVEYQLLIGKNYDYRIRYNNIRSIFLENYNRSDHLQELSSIYEKRLEILQSLRGRIEHALTKYKPLISQQLTIYQEKGREARDILENPLSKYIDSGFVKDFSLEMNLDIIAAAKLVDSKFKNWQEHLQKIERLRIRYFNAIKSAKTEDEFTQIKQGIDNDFFINMLM